MTASEPTPVPAPRRTRGKRKPGAASSVAISAEVADILDELVARCRKESKWDVDRCMVVARLIREAGEQGGVSP